MVTTSRSGNTTFLRIGTLVALTLSALWSATAAMPPHPDIQAGIERGEVVRPFQRADYPGLPACMKINGPGQRLGPPVTGPFRVLCILVDFSDNQFQVHPADFDTLIFGNRSGTVRHYYQEVSYTQLDLVAVDLPSTLGWRRAPETYAYYVDDNYGTESPYPNNSQKLCEDLVDLVDSLVDFSQYDNDQNGFVDVVMIVHAGPGAEFSGSRSDIWSHKWSMIPRNKDGVYVSEYTIMPEFWNGPGDMTIGVFCHELGHAFGLLDLYDTDGSSFGTGYWSVMSTGCWNGSLGASPAHPDAWSRARLGWVTPTNILINTTDVSIADIESNGAAFRLWTSGSVGSEYFLVENRQRVGYDAGLPASGLLIWHIDESVLHNNYEWYPGHVDFGHYMVALEQADNQFQLEKRLSCGDTGDPYPGVTGNTSFSPVSSPNSDAYSDASSFVAVTGISPSGSVMTADFVVSFVAGNDDEEIDPPGIPRLTLGQNYPNPFNPATRFEYTLPAAGEIEISVYNVLGERVNRLVSGYHQPGTYSAIWNGTDFAGRDVPSGVYLYELVNDEENVVRKMMLLR